MSVNVEDILQQENDAHLSEVLPAILFISVLMFFGFFGNALVFYVYMFKFKPSTLRIFIIALAALDTFICAFDIPLRIAVLRYKYTLGRYRDLCKTFYTFHDLLFLTSMYMLISVAVERYKKVCHPLDNQMTILSAKVTMCVCFVLAFLFALPAAFKYGTKTIPTSVDSVNGTQCYTDDHHDPMLVKVNYVFWIITNIGVLTVLIVLYCLIWRRVSKQLQFRKNSSMLRHRNIEKSDHSTGSVENSHPSNGKGDSHSVDNEQRAPLNAPIAEKKSAGHSKLQVSDSFSSDHKKKSLARKQSIWRTEDKRLQGVRKMTTVMFLVTLVSILAYLPVVSKMIIRLIDASVFRNFKISAPWVYNVYVHTYYIQCAANPLIYSFRNTHFRHELKRLLVKRRTSISSSGSH